MPKRQVRLWGLISRQSRWGLTVRGWLSILLAIALLFWLLSSKLEPFLASSIPVEAEILVVEGWIGDDALMGAIAEFERKSYELLITTGSDFGRGEFLSEYKDFAHLSQATLITLGLEPEKIQPIRTPRPERDRTLTSAREVKKWLKENEIYPSGINVYSDNVHGRRSWLIYQKVLEPEIEVGVISHPAQNYDPDAWWASSEGFKKVTSETLSYIYTKFLF